LQDLVLSVHHAVIQTMAATATMKLIENHLGAAYIEAVQADPGADASSDSGACLVTTRLIALWRGVCSYFGGGRVTIGDCMKS
jgi:hypothetical protein